MAVGSLGKPGVVRLGIGSQGLKISAGEFTEVKGEDLAPESGKYDLGGQCHRDLVAVDPCQVPVQGLQHIAAIEKDLDNGLAIRWDFESDINRFLTGTRGGHRSIAKQG